MLSQDEINALLNGMNEEKDDAQGETLTTEDYLTGIEQDALGEIGNISFGSAATALSTLLNEKVDITTPKVSVIQKDELEEEFPKPHVAIHVEYTVGFEGVNVLVIKTSDAAIIADLMLGGDGQNVSEDLSEMHISAVQEAMNQMMGSASTSMSTIFSKRVDISPPGIDLLDVKRDEGMEAIPSSEVLANIAFDLKVGNLIDSKIMQLVTIPFAKEMVELLLNPEADEQQDKSEGEGTNTASGTKTDLQPNNNESVQTSSQKERRGGEQHQKRSEELQYVTPNPLNQRTADVQPAAFSNFDSPSIKHAEAKNLDMLLDIPLEVTVELGRTKRSIKEILELSQGSILELDKLAGEPVDVLVNQKLIAKGEVVVIDENFGVRVTDIVSQKDRLHKLK